MKMLVCSLFFITVLVLAGVSQAVTVDFESTPVGTYNILNFPDFNIIYTGGNGNFQVYGASPGPPLSGHTIISYYDNPGIAPWKLTFNISNVNSFKVAVGDYNADVDNDYLEAYDASNNLLASDYYQNPASTYGGGYLEVTTSTPIAYVKFWDAEPYPGAVYWDNITYEVGGHAVPEPATMFLLGSGLVGLAGYARKRMKK